MALPCSGGAVPKPGLTAATALLDLGLVGTDVLDHIAKVWPGLISQTIWGRVDVATLCAQQAEDPGPPSPEDLAYTAILAAQAAGGSLGGAYGSWALKQIYYQVFLNSCQCADGITVPPPHRPVPPPNPTDLYPTDPNARDVITKILDNQQTSGEALTTLYNGLQLGVTDIRDAVLRLRQNDIFAGTTNSFAMSGEGQHDLQGAQMVEVGIAQDVLGLVVQLTSIPPTVKRRGQVYQRLYGVGSVEWNATQSTGQPHLITQRDSIHYERQFIHAPQSATSYSVRWRLQPGVAAMGYQVWRDPERAGYRPYDPHPAAYQTFDNWSAPPGWIDAPFYPQSAEIRELPSGGGLPPAEFPCCS